MNWKRIPGLLLVFVIIFLEVLAAVEAQPNTTSRPQGRTQLYGIRYQGRGQGYVRKSNVVASSDGYVTTGHGLSGCAGYQQFGGFHANERVLGMLMQPNETISFSMFANPQGRIIFADFATDVGRGFNPDEDLFIMIGGLSGIKEGCGQWNSLGLDAANFFNLYYMEPSPDTAGPIGYDEAYNRDMLTPAGDEWTFGGTAGDVITIRAQGNNAFNTYIWLTDPIGQVIAENDNPDATDLSATISNFTLTEDGIYTILVKSADGSIGSYQLSLTYVPPVFTVEVIPTIPIVTIIPQTFTCWASLPSRLVGLTQARVTDGTPNNIRAGVESGTIYGQIPAGAVFNIRGGPECGNGTGRIWWYVEYKGVIGWTAEANEREYWLGPVEGSANNGGDQTVNTCSYAVVRGDTLFRIAQRYGVPVSTLAAANNIVDVNRIEVGLVLQIPNCS